MEPVKIHNFTKLEVSSFVAPPFKVIVYKNSQRLVRLYDVFWGVFLDVVLCLSICLFRWLFL